MANSKMPYEVSVRLTRQARDYAYRKVGLNPDTSNPTESQQREIVNIGNRKYEELKSDWLSNNS